MEYDLVNASLCFLTRDPQGRFIPDFRREPLVEQALRKYTPTVNGIVDRLRSTVTDSNFGTEIGPLFAAALYFYLTANRIAYPLPRNYLLEGVKTPAWLETLATCASPPHFQVHHDVHLDEALPDSFISAPKHGIIPLFMPWP